MVKARPHKGPREFRSTRARRLNRNGLAFMAVALAVGAFTASLWFGAGGPNGAAGPVLALLTTAEFGLCAVAFVSLVVARRFERTDVAVAEAQVHREVKAAHLRAAPRVPVGLPQPVGSGANGDGT